MLRRKGRPKLKQEELDEMFRRADKKREQGDLRSAFRLFLIAAKAGGHRS